VVEEKNEKKKKMPGKGDGVVSNVFLPVNLEKVAWGLIEFQRSKKGQYIRTRNHRKGAISKIGPAREG
jgi:hypothetical protein